MTRKEYEQLPHLETMWLADMQVMADELSELFDKVDREHLPDPDVNQMMGKLIGEASDCIKGTKMWDDLTGLQYTYWCCIDELEQMDALAHAKGDQEMKHTAMLRSQVLAAWLWALNHRIEDLGGEIRVE